MARHGTARLGMAKHAHRDAHAHTHASTHARTHTHTHAHAPNSARGARVVSLDSDAAYRNQLQRSYCPTASAEDKAMTACRS